MIIVSERQIQSLATTPARKRMASAWSVLNRELEALTRGWPHDKRRQLEISKKYDKKSDITLRLVFGEPRRFYDLDCNEVTAYGPSSRFTSISSPSEKWFVLTDGTYHGLATVGQTIFKTKAHAIQMGREEVQRDVGRLIERIRDFEQRATA